LEEISNDRELSWAWRKGQVLSFALEMGSAGQDERWNKEEKVI